MLRYNNISRPVHDLPRNPCDPPTTPSSKSGGRDPPNPQDWRLWNKTHLQIKLNQFQICNIKCRRPLHRNVSATATSPARFRFQWNTKFGILYTESSYCSIFYSWGFISCHFVYYMVHKHSEKSMLSSSLARQRLLETGRMQFFQRSADEVCEVTWCPIAENRLRKFMRYSTHGSMTRPQH